MQPLLNDDLVSSVQIIDARRHTAVPPLKHRASLVVRFGFIDSVRIIHDHVVAAFARAGFTRAAAEAVLACATPDEAAALLRDAMR